MGLLYKCLHTKSVTVKAESADYALAGRRQIGVMTKLLTGVHIADMHLNDWTFQRTYAVMECYGGVGICASIEHHAVIREAYLLEFVYHLTLNVALVILQLYLRITLLQLWQIALKGAVAVDSWFTNAKQVEVRTVHYKYLQFLIKFINYFLIIFINSRMPSLAPHCMWVTFVFDATGFGSMR